MGKFLIAGIQILFFNFTVTFFSLHDVKEEQYFVQHLPSDMTEQRLVKFESLNHLVFANSVEREYFESLGAVHKIALVSSFFKLRNSRI